MRTVLLVEDDEDIRTVGELALGRVGGLEVRTAASGQEALDIACAEPPDVILLDVMMPGMDGPEVLQRLRENPGTREVPVVFLTAKAHRDEIARLRALGVAGVLTKPFDPMALATELLAILDGCS
jgi:CheY-like chemotaxis protein